MSEYGLQFVKTESKIHLWCFRKTFPNYFKKADQMKGLTGENLMIILESQTGQRSIPSWIC